MGLARLRMILKYTLKAVEVHGDEEFARYTLKEDLPAQIAGVKALIAGQVAFRFFEIPLVRSYLKKT